MLPRILEPEVMDTREEACDYDAMDHSTVNRVFVDDFLNEAQRSEARLFEKAGLLEHSETSLEILDTGTGTALIPVELLSRFDDKTAIRITAIDLAAEMLKVAERNVDRANFADAIRLECVDCKSLPYADGTFDAVISNSIVHHIPEPQTVIAEMWRVLRPGGLFFLRDLLRPADLETLDSLVQTYAGDENTHQRQMFRDSLHAALTLAELRTLLGNVGIPPDSARQTTDRHWTVATMR